MSKKFLIFPILILLVVVLTGCKISFGDKTSSGSDGGIFKSSDKGENWQASNLIPTSLGVPANINSVNIKKIIADPQDHLTLYLITAGNGLFFSYDGAENWQIPRSQPLEMKTLEDLAIDSQNSCTLYAATNNLIFKSTNCARGWEKIYHGTRLSDVVTSVAVDWYSPEIIYAGTSEGNFLQSTDSGVSWTNIKQVGKKITKILIDPYDSRILYLVTSGNGIFKTVNRGVSWTNIKKQLSDYSGALQIRDLIFGYSERDSLIMATKYGLLKSGNGGEDWQKIKMITQPGKATIYSLTVDPENNDGIYYATASTFYKSLDGGENWATKKLPSSRAATALLIDFADPKVLYLGVTKLKK